MSIDERLFWQDQEDLEKEVGRTLHIIENFV